MKVDPTERLARDICWAGFTPSYRRMMKRTKVQYWASMSPEARESYMADARMMKTTIPRLPRMRVEELVAPILLRGGRART